MVDRHIPWDGESDDEFDRRIDGLLAGAGDARDDEIAVVVDALRASAGVPDDLAARHIARLVAAIPAPGRVVPLRRKRRVVMRTAVAGVALTATLGGGVGMAAAANTRPGDLLYGLKTARERLQLSLARDGDGRARLELTLSRTRLDEAASLLRTGDVARAVETLARADAALVAARSHGSDAVDTAAGEELSRRVVVLSALLEGGLPTEAAAAAREAIAHAITRGNATPNDGGSKPGDKPNPRPTPTSIPSQSGRPSQPPGKGRPSDAPSDERPDTRPSPRSGKPTTSPRGPGVGKR